MKISQHYQLAFCSTSTHFQDDLTVILENRKIRVFQKEMRKVKHFKICNLHTCNNLVREVFGDIFWADIGPSLVNSVCSIEM